MFSMPDEEISRTIEGIGSGSKVVQVEDGSGKKVFILFKHPTLEHKESSYYMYSQALIEAEEQGILSIKQMKEISKTRSFFSQEDSKKLESIESKLKGQYLVLKKTTRVPARRNRVKEVIARLEGEASILRYNKDKYLENTSERKAAEERLLFLSFCCTYKPSTNSKYWELKSDFDSETDSILRRNIFTEFVMFYHGLGSTIIRYIARSNLWRIRYMISVKTGESLFNKGVNRYDTNQLMLVYWSNYYQSIYEMLPADRPTNSIIEDDTSLDAYMSDWHAEKSRDDVASSNSNKYGNNSAWDKGEVLVFKSNDMYEDIEYSETLTSSSKGRSSIDSAAFGRGKEKRS